MQVKLEPSTLKFATEKERNEHKLAKRIPKVLWEDESLFNMEVSESSLDFMSVHPKVALKDTNPFLISTVDWICCVLGNTEVHDIDLIQLAKKNNIESKVLFSIACRIDRQEMLSEILNQQKALNLSTKDILSIACSYNNQSVISTILSKSTELGIEHQEIFAIACATGNVLLLTELLKDKTDAQKLTLVKHNNYLGYIAAIQGMHFEFLRVLKEETGLIDDLEKQDYKLLFSLFKSALEEGQLEVLQYFKESHDKFLSQWSFTQHNNGQNDFHDLLCLASQNGFVDIMNKVFGCDTNDLMKDNYAVIRAAAKGKQSSVLQRFQEKYETISEALENAYNEQIHIDLYQSTAKKGHVDNMVRLEKKFPELLEELLSFNDFEVLKNNLAKPLVVRHLMSHQRCREFAAGKEEYKSALTTYEREQANITKLGDTINKLEQYGQTLYGKADKNSITEGGNAVKLANKLRAIFKEFLDAQEIGDSAVKADAQTRFKARLKTGYNQMKHRNPIVDILAEIAIAATGIGLIAMAIKWAVTGTGFFSHTNREKQAKEIENVFNSLCSDPRPMNIEMNVI